MIRVQARRAGYVDENELVYIGEIFYDDAEKRFGVFTNENSTTIRWLPRWVNENLALNINQKLTGIVETGDINNIVLDFTNQDSVKFVNALTGEIYMNLTPNGAVFLRSNDNISEIAGSSNIAINGNLLIPRTVGAESTFTTSIDGNSFMFAPNWYVYSYPSSSGMLMVSYEDTELATPDTILHRALRVSSSGNVSNNGLRSFFFDYPFVENRYVTITFRVKGPEGVTATSRVLSETDSLLASAEITGTGEYQVVSYPCYLPPSSSKWWAVDTLFEPGKDSSFSSEWLVGGLQVNIGTVPAILERRTTAIEQNLVDTLYQEGRLLIGSDTVKYPVSTPSLIQPPDRVLIVNPEDGNSVVSDVDSTGFNIAIHTTSSSNFIVKYAAFLAPLPTPDF